MSWWVTRTKHHHRHNLIDKVGYMHKAPWKLIRSCYSHKHTSTHSCFFKVDHTTGVFGFLLVPQESNQWKSFEKGHRERLPFVWKTRKFREEFNWNGSSRWKFSGKKVIPFEVLPFSRFYRNDRNFLYHLFGLLVPGFMSVFCKWYKSIPFLFFRCQKKYRYHLAEIFHRNFRTNSKRSGFSFHLRD